MDLIALRSIKGLLRRRERGPDLNSPKRLNHPAFMGL
jgi:hypothetical protein